MSGAEGKTKASGGDPVPARDARMAEVSDEDLCTEIEARGLASDVLKECTDLEVAADYERRGLDDFDCEHECDHEQCWLEPRDVERAYLALSADTPEPIRTLVLELSGRII